MISKTEANYKPPGRSLFICYACSMFTETGRACTLVAGDISPLGTCDHWVFYLDTKTKA